MDFEDAKENIQPLASGRNASVLACSLTSHSELQKQRDILEAEIKNYEGDDPLEPWYDYILWIEQSYPSGGKESGLKKVLLKCLMTFEEDKRYYQDRRMIRIFIKYIDTEENPCELYQELFNSGIGTMIADLYICWAYYYDLAGNFQKADSIFKKGLELRAQPYDELEQAHKHFGFIMSQRILHQDETSKAEFITSMKERRNVLTSLRPHKKKVGSIRTGSVVKSINPGKIKLSEVRISPPSCRSNSIVQVFEDQNRDPNFPLEPIPPEEHHIPVVRNIIDSARKQENLREPGPWTKGLNKKGHLFDKSQTHNHEMAFTILEDDKECETTEKEFIIGLPQKPDNYSKGIILPLNFPRKNYPQGEWKIKTVADDEIKAQVIPQYCKILCYPKPDVEFCPEEVRAYKWLKHYSRDNKFVETNKKYFANEISVGCRLYNNFCRKNLPDKNIFKLSNFKHNIIPNSKLVVHINEIYSGIENDNIYDEKQFEEILFEKIKSGKRKIKFDGNETICVEEEMDETQCFTNIVGRKSIFPSRKSMAPISMDRKTIFKPTIPTLEEQTNLEDYASEKSSIKNAAIYQGSESRKSVIRPNITWTPIKENKKNIQENTSDNAHLNHSKPALPKIFKNIATSSKNVESSNDSKTLTSNSIQNQHSSSDAVDEILSSLKVSTPITKENTFPDDYNHISKQPVKNALDKEDKSSVILSKTEENAVFDVFTDENNIKNKVKTQPEKNNLDNFEIYTDPDESFKFKQPHLPVKNVLQPKIPLPVFEDCVDEIAKPSNSNGFEADETCSTQAFNLFIRAQSISTPIGKKNVTSHIKESNNENMCSGKNALPINLNLLSDSEQKICNQAGNLSNSSSNSGNSPEFPGSSQINQERNLNTSPYCPEQVPYKQLSTIMETSETNTLPTANTKSSVDPHANSTDEAENIVKQCESRKTLIDHFRFSKSNIDGKSICKNNETNKMSILENASAKTVQQTFNIKSFIDKSSIPFGGENKDKQSENGKTESSNIEKNGFDRNSTINNNEIIKISKLDNKDLNSTEYSKSNINTTESNNVNSSKSVLVGENLNENDLNETKRKSVITSTNKFNDENSLIISEKLKSNELDITKRQEIDLNFSRNQKLESSKTNTESFLKIKPVVVKNDEILMEKISEDTTHHLNLKSIQIFEEKTETVTKFALKRQANVEEEPKSDLYNFFVKTPERNGPVISAPISGFEINDTLTFSNLKELTLPKLSDTNKFIVKDSPVSKLAKFSFNRTHDDSIKKPLKSPSHSFIPPKITFEEQLQILPNLDNLTKLQEKQTEKSFILPLQKNFEEHLPALPEFRDLTLPKLQEKQNEKSFVLPIQTNLEEQLSILPHLSDLTLPKLTESQIEKSFENTFRNSRKLSFLQKSRQIEEDNNKSTERKTVCTNNDSIFQKEASNLINFDSVSKAKSKLITNKSSDFSFKHLNSTKPIQEFEDNVQTDVFGLHVSSIKNSTFLPQKQHFQNSEQILEKSLHIKQEIIENESPRQISLNYSEENLLQKKSLINKNNSQLTQNVNYCNTLEHEPCLGIKSLVISEVKAGVNNTNEECTYEEENALGRSIYLKHSFKTPTVGKHYWVDIENDECTDENFVHHRSVNLDQTNVLINEKIMDVDVNPFSSELTKAFLEKIGFSLYLSELESCELRGKLSVLNKGNEVTIRNNAFIILKIVGEGAFGTIYSAKEKSTGKLYAMKQEKPANLWEYYICLELRSRINNTHILPGLLDVEYALIGNNASILVSEYSKYGSFITICNTYKRKTNKNLDEYIVFILTTQILAIIDHLHASHIIHADVKPDNFLLMSKLSWPINKLAVQLIDFGISIDMQLFPKNQSFTYSHSKEDYKCIEMRLGRPWTYQIDLFGLAGTIHVLLYGKYMDIEKNVNGFWAPKQRIPRYLNKNIWEPLFQNLLNIRDCNTMPNLQSLRTIIEQTLADKERYVIEKVNEFNLCL